MAIQRATFGAGCYWGTEAFFKRQFNLRSIAVGFMGGKGPNPSYREVCSGKTGHAEVAQLEYSDDVSYADLVSYFFQFHDPTTKNRQGNDTGSQYRSVIFYHSQEQREIAERVRDEVSEAKRFPDKIVTEIVPASEFYPAQNDHQAYLDKNPGGYCNHRIRWRP